MSEPQAVHNNIFCDACNVSPIIGIRYKCKVLKDFDYCSQCHATIPHPHDFEAISEPLAMHFRVECDGC